MSQLTMVDSKIKKQMIKIVLITTLVLALFSPTGFALVTVPIKLLMINKNWPTTLSVTYQVVKASGNLSLIGWRGSHTYVASQNNTSGTTGQSYAFYLQNTCTSGNAVLYVTYTASVHGDPESVVQQTHRFKITKMPGVLPTITPIDVVTHSGDNICEFSTSRDFTTNYPTITVSCAT